MSISSTLSVIAPQFDSLPAARITAAINIAQRQMSPTAWAELFEDGAANLAAHILTVSERESANSAGGVIGAAGSVNSVKTGGLAVSFGAVGAATASGEEAALRTTPYGLEYLRLRALVPHQPLVVGFI